MPLLGLPIAARFSVVFVETLEIRSRSHRQQMGGGDTTPSAATNDGLTRAPADPAIQDWDDCQVISLVALSARGRSPERLETERSLRSCRSLQL